MKKMIVMISVLAATGLTAQEATKSSGNKMWLGGSLGYGSNNVKNGETGSNWNVGPSFGFMLNDKMAVGINAGVFGSTLKRKNLLEDVTKTSGWNAAPFFRYYFAGAGNFKFFGDAYVAFSGGKVKYTNNISPGSETTYNSFGGGIRPGIQYWFNPNWSVASTIGALSYVSETDKSGGTSTVNTKFDAKVDFSTINFSLFWHF